MTAIRASVEVGLDPRAAFDALVDELGSAFERLGLRLERGPGGRVLQGEREVGRVKAWEEGTHARFEWHGADWDRGLGTEVELRVDASPEGSTVTVEQRGWEALVGDRRGELVGWFAAEVAAPLLAATAPARFGDWLTDRRARRPSGAEARVTYADPLYHRPNFRVLLELLALTREDYLLEVGCGGGVLLHDALESGCRAAAVDHSPEMVRLAREVNSSAVEDGRLDVVEASAERLPFADETFTCAAMTGVLGFLPDAAAAFAEIRRVLVSGGRFVALGSDPELRGTPAAPEPMASRLRFYESDELELLARDAGLYARVERHSLERHAREVGVPEEHLPLFAGPGARFLVADKS